MCRGRRCRRMGAQNRPDLSGDIKIDGQATLKLTTSGGLARRHFRSWRFAADSPPSRKCVMQRRSVVRRHQGMQFRHARHLGIRTAEARDGSDGRGRAWAFPLEGVRCPTHPRRGNASHGEDRITCRSLRFGPREAQWHGDRAARHYTLCVAVTSDATMTNGELKEKQ